MLDIKYIIENKEEVKQALLKRMSEKDLDLDKIIALDNERRELINSTETLKAEKNQHSKSKPSTETIAKLKELNQDLKDKEGQLKKTEQALKEGLSSLPNIPDASVKTGDKENNEVTYTYSKKPEFSFKPKDHVELAKNLGIIDYERAAKMSGSGFWIYKDKGAWLEWALISYFLDYHRKNNYKFLLMPYLLNEDSAYASGHLPKFRDDLFWTQDDLCLNATAEMMLTNYHRQEILDSESLPIKYFSYAPSFRREAGSYRQEERGMIRGHQFNKVEMFQFTHPDDSWKTFELMEEEVKKLVAGLDLHFQISLLAAKDASAAMAKTVDVEIWIPSMNIYKEVSSISNATDYQARRAQIRFKDKTSQKNMFVHTLNASGLATSRLIPAILEQNQQADGSVTIPKALHKYLPKQYWVLK